MRHNQTKSDIFIFCELQPFAFQLKTLVTALFILDFDTYVDISELFNMDSVGQTIFRSVQ